MYVVKGTYRLGSEKSATLASYVTTSADSKFNSTPNYKTQNITVQQGEGRFSLIFYMWDKGKPHLAFYPANGGTSFGNVYFGTGDSLLVRGYWEKREPDAAQTGAERPQPETDAERYLRQQNAVKREELQKLIEKIQLQTNTWREKLDAERKQLDLLEAHLKANQRRLQELPKTPGADEKTP